MKWAVPPSAPALLVSDAGRVIRMASSRRKGKGWQTFPEIKHGRCWAWLDQQVTGSKG
jgi:hypothetical protein